MYGIGGCICNMDEKGAQTKNRSRKSNLHSVYRWMFITTYCESIYIGNNPQ